MSKAHQKKNKVHIDFSVYIIFILHMKTILAKQAKRNYISKPNCCVEVQKTQVDENDSNHKRMRK